MHLLIGTGEYCFPVLFYLDRKSTFLTALLRPVSAASLHNPEALLQVSCFIEAEKPGGTVIHVNPEKVKHTNLLKYLSSDHLLKYKGGDYC